MVKSIGKGCKKHTDLYNPFGLAETVTPTVAHKLLLKFAKGDR